MDYVFFQKKWRENMYKLITFVFRLFHLPLFIRKKISKGFICGRMFVTKISGNLKIQMNCTFRNFCFLLVTKGAELHIGADCFFNNNCSINCNSYIEIGDNCIFGENVKLYDHNHNYKTNELVKDATLINKPIFIGSNNWFGSNVVILAGVKIGSNCVIGANTTVYKDIPSNTLLLQNGIQKKIIREC